MIAFDTPYLGPNVPQEPKWDSRDWEDVLEWIVDGAHAKGEGTAIHDARQWGRDPDTPGDTRPGPWQSIHTSKIFFTHNQLGSVLVPVRRYIWTWERSSIDGREVGGEVILSFGDANSGITADPAHGIPGEMPGLPRLYWGGGAGGYASTPVVLNADTDYVLEIDFVGQVNARIYEAGDDAPDWGAAVPLYTGHGADRSSLRMQYQSDTADILLIDQIDVAMGPRVGQVFGPIVVGYGDEETDTFFGQPTVEGSVLWYVDGHLVKPKSVNEATGQVIFDRPPQYQSVISQVGKYAE